MVTFGGDKGHPKGMAWGPRGPENRTRWSRMAHEGLCPVSLCSREGFHVRQRVSMFGPNAAAAEWYVPALLLLFTCVPLCDPTAPDGPGPCGG